MQHAANVSGTPERNRMARKSQEGSRVTHLGGITPRGSEEPDFHFLPTRHQTAAQSQAARAMLYDSIPERKA